MAGITAAVLIGGCAHRDQTAAPAAAPTATAAAGLSAAATPGAGPASPRPSTEPGGDDNLLEPSAAAPAAAAPAAAAAFAQTWVRRDLNAAQWHAAIAPLCEKTFAAQLATTDPANLPASRVTGTPRVLQAPADRTARYSVATSGGTLTVILIDLGGRWLVAGDDFTVQ